MTNIISSEKINRHKVDKYNFKVLSVTEELNTEIPQSNVFANDSFVDNNESIKEREVDSSSMTQSSKDSLIESLLNKTDEMSSNFIKLQMKLENMTQEHKEELQKTKEDSFALGIEAGVEKALKDDKNSIASVMTQYNASIQKLEKNATEFESALEKIKEELIGAALDISKEVLKVELSENSHKVAILLAKELIKELQTSSKITLRVNSKDHGEVSQALGSLAHVEIISDSAVSVGGVIAISEAGNIDAQISKRFERVKRAALSE
ncbi:putative flagellar assembly protein [Sulfurimonas denitrificans DSM 1251]|uniref:Flagellar assembly protein FliH n=1 Tax=Sulfurimonas denitrificans (strain ATCC 33889 / DSM 1251) TaxID=326298 RepID=Q30TC6_SULDN|nr:flagellar assembly protein FliH [Sulfurimonas denitrificans]ABB43755.1 putative flagellar assembly protein [Sulfurimonas denitrificans DSM 1251]MDD3442423.1 flagellar assembly protein FliH [Sulfurimonas denitrificans]